MDNFLNPYARNIYLEDLRPPESFVFDRGIATTFSLDLLTLLMVPLSMVLFESNSKDEILKDPIGVLEALRQTSDKLGIFCQQGRISVPRNDSLLYSYLERIVVEVQPLNKRGVFHPKTWALRYVNPNTKEIYYRFICSSRNLTFDHSWDTSLVLEGLLEKRQKAFWRNHPLADFIGTLPNLAVSKLSPAIKEHVRILIKELPYVRFKPPEEFEDDITFIPLGIEGYKKGPRFSRSDRLLIMSPFLDGKHIELLAENGSRNVLISRAESLDAISDQVFKKVVKNTQVYIMNVDAEKPAIENQDENEKAILADQSGLHAKVYLSEEGWYTRIISGSANATSAAFDGSNIEFQVDIVGRRSKFGINSLLDEKAEASSFRSLLRKYQRPDKISPEDAIKKKLTEILEGTRKSIIMTELKGEVFPNSYGTFDLTISVSRKLSLNPAVSEGVFYPITLQQSDGKPISCLVKDGSVAFSRISLVSLTGFFAFRFSASEGKVKIPSLGFVLNIPIEGIPEHRDSLILRSIISDKKRFIRYLLFLLSEDPASFQLTEIVSTTKGSQNVGSGGQVIGLPLFEELVRAYSRHPEKIRHVKRLIEELTQSEEGRALLPEGFEAIWSIFLEAIEDKGIVTK